MPHPKARTIIRESLPPTRTSLRLRYSPNHGIQKFISPYKAFFAPQATDHACCIVKPPNEFGEEPPTKTLSGAPVKPLPQNRGTVVTVNRVSANKDNFAEFDDVDIRAVRRLPTDVADGGGWRPKRCCHKKRTPTAGFLQISAFFSLRAVWANCIVKASRIFA